MARTTPITVRLLDAERFKGAVVLLAEILAEYDRQMTAEPGDWIVRGVAGEFYPCKPDIFDATYEPAAAPTPPPPPEPTP